MENGKTERFELNNQYNIDMKLAIKTQCLTGTNILAQLGRITTGLHNTANYQRKETLKITGKMPSWAQQCKELKDHKLARLLNAQVAQQTIIELDRGYKSYFVLKKNGHKDAQPPGFRKPNTPKSIWFTPASFKILSPNEIRFSIANLGINQQFLIVKIIPDQRHDITKLNVKMINITFKDNKVYASLCLEISEPKPESYTDITAIDLGIKNLVASTNTKGNQSLISGRKLLSIQRYFNKKVAKLQSIKDKQGNKRSTKTIRKLKQKQARQIKHLLHIASKQLVYEAKKNNSCIVIGDLTNIRKNNNKGKKINQKIHSWSFGSFTSLLKYKCMLSGVNMFKISERYTSRICANCKETKRSNRVKRGLYKCKCGYVCNADINGAKNILFRFLGYPENITNVSPLSLDNGVVVHGMDQSIFRFDNSNLNRQKILTREIYHGD